MRKCSHTHTKCFHLIVKSNYLEKDVINSNPIVYIKYIYKKKTTKNYLNQE